LTSGPIKRRACPSCKSLATAPSARPASGTNSSTIRVKMWRITKRSQTAIGLRRGQSATLGWTLRS